MRAAPDADPAPLRFRISWVLRAELALGPAPRHLSHVVALEEQGVRGVLSLCSLHEAPPPAELEQRLLCRRVPLPDHRSGRAPEPHELEQALTALRQLSQEGPVFVHCVAAVERSPLLCLGWLMQRRRLSQLQALDYLMQVHPGTGPLPEQLASLRTLLNSLGES